MSEKDLYGVLGIPRGSSDADIKKAYRSLAMKYHPDRNKGDTTAEQKFKEISSAYEVLKDGEKRAAYDRFGMAGVDPQSRASGAGGGSPFTGSGFSDIFEEFFGHTGGNRRDGGRGRDLRFDLQLTLEEAYKGVSRQISFARSDSCDACDGTGGEGGDKSVRVCGSCMGEGVRRFQQSVFSIEQTCDACGGRGRLIENPCRRCSGKGLSRKEKKLDVNVPAGIDNQNKVRLPGEGDLGSNGQRGDLYIVTNVKDHEVYKRDVSTLMMRMPIGMMDAILGSTVEIPTLDGIKTRVNIKAGIQNGQRLRIASKGMPFVRQKKFGDLIIEVYVETPVSLTKAQKELLEKFREEGASANNAPESRKFFDRLKKLFTGDK